MMKKLLSLVCMLAVFCLLSGAAEATRELPPLPPLRVAQFPLQMQGRMQPAPHVQDKLERLIDRSLHIPFNDSLQVLSFIPEGECFAAWDKVCAAGGDKVRIKDLMRPLAQELKADLVVMPVLAGYEQYQSMSWHHWGRYILHSYASVRIVGYDRVADEVFSKTVSRRYDDEISLQGDVDNLAYEAMDGALRQARIHDRVWEWKARKYGTGSAPSGSHS
ncbi:hypothetical protein SAMN05216582_103157 [Selenomonas ruminantium]|uniref:Lipoprotein n=2 Tax=Selenomonas ruminantium TaxID=971 RepID=A0A1M6S7G8_SELRU|nr:hypothetical protein SAMN05216582_103157 [Selenomonas ruminantium]